MNKLMLTLRQRKLLYYMMTRKKMVTGKELSREMNVTDRTIRSDVAEINLAIAPFRAQIYSMRSKGYWFAAEDDEKIHELNQIELGLLTKEERVRYLALRLCLTEHPLHIYDLEEEMFTSRTTLEQDLKSLQKKYVSKAPFIKLLQKNNEISFEADERKIRTVLTRLAHDDWSYHIQRNAYYEFHFLDGSILEQIMDIVPICLYKNGIFMEDPALVYLDLMIAIAYQRQRDGHPLPECKEPFCKNPEAYEACREIFTFFREQFSFDFSEPEKREIHDQIVTTRLPENIAELENPSSIRNLDPETIRITDRYLEMIRTMFGIDLYGDDDFYVTLNLTINTFQNEFYIYNTQGNWAFAKDRMQDEMEIAVLFQKIAMESIGRLLTEIELINLAHCISGALVFLFQSHPELKLRTVICTHRNMMSVWHLKRVLLSQFNTYLEVSGLIPVNSNSSYDFSHTDLVLTTVDVPITDHSGTETILISYFITPEDSARITEYIKRKRFERLCPVLPHSLGDLLRNAYWHEREQQKTISGIIRILSQDFRNDPGLGDSLEQDILQRENITSFVTGRSIAFLSSFLPAEKTALSVMTLEHRVIWNGQKIRIIVLATFRPEDLPALFHLKHFFCDRDREAMRMLKGKEEICDFFTLP